MRTISLVSALLVGGIGLSKAGDRTIDGSNNNAGDADQGSVGQNFLRLGPAMYDTDGSTPLDSSRPNPREVSNSVSAQNGSVLNARGLSDFVWLWGQFIDHDITLTETGNESYDIPVGGGDPLAPSIPLNRSLYDPTTGTSTANPRQQFNGITTYLDASMVYGSDAARAAALRTGAGGRLATSAGDMLPFNTGLLDNANEGTTPDASLYLAGDVRANEQTALTAMHTLFVREHNRLAGEIAYDNPGWSDEQVYQRARKIVGGIVQSITYNEFLPALMGNNAPQIATATYNTNTNPEISNEFATALFRVGHTMVSPSLLQVDGDGNRNTLSLASAFFDPSTMADGDDLDSTLRGLGFQAMQEVDTMLADELRNQLFGPPGAGGLDLAALNIQRGRDHGLPGYNTVRVQLGLGAALDFADITSDPNLQLTLSSLYSTVGEVDLWVGALAEDHLPGSSLGELLTAGFADQFTRLMEGDRFFFTFDPELAALEGELMATTLGAIIWRNTGVTELGYDVFHKIPEPSTGALLIGALLCAAGRRRRSC